MNKVLCLGDACADIIIPYGEALEGKDVEVTFSSGGTMANSASALGRLGVDCAFLGVCGYDYYGIAMKEELINDHVDCSRFKLKNDLSTVSIMAIIDQNKDRFNFLFPKKKPSHLEIYDEDLDDSLLDEFDCVLTSGLMLFEKPACESVVRFLKKCHERGIRICLDINMRIETKNMDTKYLMEAVEYADYLFASAKDELVPLTGMMDYRKAAMSLVTENRVVIARLGEKGSDVFTKDCIYHCDGFKVEVTDTLGAGDAFNAGFIYGLVKDKDYELCNIYGCAAAGMNITKKGARNGPTEKELIDFIGKT